MSVVIKKVLISDNVDKKCEDLLKANQIKVVSKSGLTESELISALNVRFYIHINISFFF